MVDLCLIVVLLATTVQLGEARWGQAAKYDNHIDAGVRGQGHLKHPYSGLYVGVDQHGLLMYVPEPSPDTEWKFTSDNRWVHVSDGRCVHPRGGAEYPPDDTPLLLEDCAPYNPGRIRFKGRPDRALWNIEHIRSGKCVHPLRGWAHVGVRLVLWGECGRSDRLDYTLEDIHKLRVPLL